MKKATVVVFFVVAAMMLDLGISNVHHETVHTDVYAHLEPVHTVDTHHVKKEVVVKETEPVHHVHKTVHKTQPAVVDKKVFIEKEPAVLHETVTVEEEPAVLHKTVLHKQPDVEKIDIIEEFEGDDK